MGTHGSENRCKHNRTQGFLIGLGLSEDINPTFCILMYYDLLALIPPTPPFVC
jgi:hypothetical protein